MNPWGLDATGLMIWGLVLHLIADWPLQNDWMANHKEQRRERWWGSHRDARKLSPAEIAAQQGQAVIITGYGNTYGLRPSRWWDRHPAAYVHAGIHGALLALVFGWVAAPLALVHLVIDTRWPVARWSKLVRQTQPQVQRTTGVPGDAYAKRTGVLVPGTIVDIGMEVRFWTDQVFHIVTLATAALTVGAL